MYEVPTSLSPSRVESFTSCPLAFRFANIERLPEAPTVHTTRGTIVHRGLELAYGLAPADRTPERFAAAIDAAIDEYATHPDVADLGLDGDATRQLADECRRLMDNALRMEDPAAVHPIGLELRLEAAIHGDAGALSLRGIIDRLELRGGDLVVTDYKTGRPPSVNWEQKSLAGVHFYSFLCEQVLGRRPAAIRLMYLRTGETIEATPSEQSVRFITTRTRAVWRAVERACATDDFRPRSGPLCGSCGFQRWCPEFGGDPGQAARDLLHGRVEVLTPA